MSRFDLNLVQTVLELICNRYHHLNHNAIFGGGYRSRAVAIMERLNKKYGK